jgi:hypothetical protein
VGGEFSELVTLVAPMLAVIVYFSVKRMLFRKPERKEKRQR